MRSRAAGSESLIISSAGDIERLRASPRRLWKLRAPVAIDILALDPAARSSWEARLNAFSDICGCTEASIVGGVATILSIAGWFYLDVEFTGRALAIAVLGVIGIALLAKFARVLLAQFQLRRALAGLLRDIPASLGSPPIR